MVINYGRWKTIRNKFTSTRAGNPIICSSCGNSVKKGDDMLWDKDKSILLCWDCYNKRHGDSLPDEISIDVDGEEEK